MEYASVIQVALATLALETFTYADGAVPATAQTGQTWTNVAGTQAILTNRLQLTSNPSTRTITHLKDFVSRIKGISAAGEGLMFRRASAGTYYWVSNDSTNGLRLYFYDGSADNLLKTNATIGVANDLIVVVAVGPNISILRGQSLTTLRVDIQYNSLVNATETVHGIIAKGNGGAVLADDWVLVPAF
jgi:hypothetical protein